MINFVIFALYLLQEGPEYSRPFSKIINEAEHLIKNGVKEITLIGQNVNAYHMRKIQKYIKYLT